MDSYALSKIVGEKTARTFARRFGNDIYALRIGNVFEPHEYEPYMPGFLKEPAQRKRNAWSYIDARDLGQLCDLCIKKSNLGFQVFNATNTTATLASKDLPVEKFLKENCPKSPITRKMGESEAPLSNRKAREVLGFVEEHSWTKYVKE